MSKRAWVTLATNDSYGLGALVLAHSLRRVGSTHSTVVLITPSVTDAMRNRLHEVFTEVVTVDVLDSRDAAHLALLQRPELGITFTKIHCWGLTQYDKCVFLDADALVVQNCDELFEREELSAAPDVGWPDCFNSGVFVYKPSTATFDALIKFAQDRGSFDGGDQGLLNSFFADWARGDINKHLPFLYNVTSAAFYSYLPALKHYGQDLKIIHFIGAAKPWLQPYNFETRSVEAPDHLRELLQLWWDLFVGRVHHQLDSSMVEDVEVEAPPMPPPDVAQHYEPSLDPQSEFRWHHPDAQPQDEATAERPDLTEFFDPWQHYRGNIPPNPNLEGSDDRQAVRDYAWEYKALAHTDAWQPAAGSQHDTHSHNEPHHHPHPHSHDHRDHSWADHSRTHSHQTDEQRGHHQHEAGQFFTRHDNPHHHHSENQHNYGNTHTQYPHDHHYDHTSHSHHDHDHSNVNRPHESAYSQSHKDFDHTQFDTTNSRVQIVHHVHAYYENKTEKVGADAPVATEFMNGYASETERYDHEDIKPRHPYDNYYLKHRSTIDSYGRKICSHEIPPTPSPSVSSESEYMTPVDSEEEDDTPGEKQVTQSGVAGNLARVVPGAVAREALDELSRRQGWEAGNIDYMGADSFANIWAKISQTLNQPRSSPPKEQPKQPSPPKDAQKQPSPPKEPAPKQPSPPKEAPADLKLAEAPAEVKPAEAPAEAKPAEVPAEAKPAEVLAAEPVADAAGKPAPVSPAVEPPKEEIKEKTDKPEVPPTPPATPKTTPEPSTPVAEVPAVEPLLAAALVAPAASVTLATAVTAAAPATPEAPATPAAPATPTTPAAPAAPATPVSPAPAAAAPAAPATPVSPAPSAAAPATPVTPTTPVSPAPAAVAPATPVTPTTPVSPAPAAVAPATPVTPTTPVSPAPAAAAPAAPATPVAPATPEAPATPAAPAAPATPVAPTTPLSAEAPASPTAAPTTPEKAAAAAAVASDSPPLANTPSKDDAPVDSAAKSEERRPLGKLQLLPPAVADPLATPDSEHEDAATLAHAIIAAELSPAPVPAEPVSLAQIGVKPKGKTTAARIASSVAPATPSAAVPAKSSAAVPAEASAIPSAAAPATPTAVAPATPSAVAPATPSAVAPATPSTAAPSTPTSETPSTPSPEAPATPISEPTSPSSVEPPKDAPKKKVVKKVVKKEGDAPVPPPRKKEKKPKEK